MPTELPIACSLPADAAAERLGSLEQLARGEELRLRIGGPDEARPILDAFLTATTAT
jgi:hypothetical protein